MSVAAALVVEVLSANRANDLVLKMSRHDACTCDISVLLG